MRAILLPLLVLAPTTALACRLPGGCEQAGGRHVQISINIGKTVPMPAAATPGEPRAAANPTDAIRQLVYEQLARECDVLLASIASSCRLANASINVHEYLNQTPPHVQVNGSGTFAVELKAR